MSPAILVAIQGSPLLLHCLFSEVQVVNGVRCHCSIVHFFPPIVPRFVWAPSSSPYHATTIILILTHPGLKDVEC